MKKLFISCLALLISTALFSQITEIEKLPEVFVSAVNYKYLGQVDSKNAPEPVQNLEQEAANYDLKSSDLYHDDYDNYSVAFYIPEGNIIAAYDGNGTILRTIEKFRNVKLPKDVNMAIAKRFPGWHVIKDVYRVTYNKDSKEGAIKSYKVKLKNGDQTVRVKLDEKGNFM